MSVTARPVDVRRARAWRRPTVTALTAALLALLLVPVSTPPADARAQVVRYSGDDRIGTSVAIARAGYPNGSPAVYLSRADGFADALAAGSLGRGPILLVPTVGPVPPLVLEEVRRLDPDDVIALGGPLAVSDQVLRDTAQGRRTGRYAGPDRYATAAAISAAAFPAGADTAYLARSDAFVDALAAGTLLGGPILLVPSTGAVPAPIAHEIARLDPATVVALGGTVAVSDQVLEDAAAGRTTDRLAGDTRYDTAAAISQAGFARGADAVYVTRSDNFADALAAGSLLGGPILPVPSCGELPAPIGDEIERLQPQVVVGLGGPVAVCDAILEAAARRNVPGAIYLSDLSAVTQDGDSWQRGAYAVDGDRYAHSLTWAADGDSYIVYDLGRDYERFRATLGISDAAETDASYRFEVLLDEAPLATHTVGWGESVDVDLDVTGGSRLRLRVTAGSGSTPVFGNARVVQAGQPDLEDAAGDPAPGPDLVHLSEGALAVPEIDGASWRLGEFEVDGDRYTDSIAWTTSGDASIAYDLGRDYATFRAVLGIQDLQDTASSYRFRLYADRETTPRLDETVLWGAAVPVEVDVTDVLRLRIEVTQVSGAHPVLAAARLTRPDVADEPPVPDADVDDRTVLFPGDSNAEIRPAPVVVSGSSWQTGSSTVWSAPSTSTSGPEWTKILYWNATGPASIEYDLGRDYTTLRTRLVFQSSAPTGSQYRVEILYDRETTAPAERTWEITRGDVVKLEDETTELDVTGVLRLKLKVTNLTDTSRNPAFARIRILQPGVTDPCSPTGGCG